LFESADIREIKLNGRQMQADRLLELVCESGLGPDVSYLSNQANVSAEGGLRQES